MYVSGKFAYSFNTPDTATLVFYEDPDTVREKAAYVIDNNLGGAAIIDIAFDDFQGLCAGKKFLLLHTVVEAFNVKYSKGLNIQYSDEYGFEVKKNVGTMLT